MIRKNAGFTLIEVLIAVVILGLGLLGLAALEATSLANTQSAFNRSQATQLAYDIIDRMRTNAGQAASYVVTAAQLAAANCPNGSNPCDACTSAANTCTPTQIAQKDLVEWRNGVRALPQGTASIAVNGGIYTVTISWDDTKGVLPPVVFETKFQI